MPVELVYSAEEIVGLGHGDARELRCVSLSGWEEINPGIDELRVERGARHAPQTCSPYMRQKNGDIHSKRIAREICLRCLGLLTSWSYGKQERAAS
jgi:hypothetical protein